MHTLKCRQVNLAMFGSHLWDSGMRCPLTYIAIKANWVKPDQVKVLLKIPEANYPREHQYNY